MITTSSTRPAVTTSEGGLLDVDQAAARLGTPTRFIRRLIAERRIRFYKIGRYVRIDPDDLALFIDNGRIDGGTEKPVPSKPKSERRRRRSESAQSLSLFD